MRPIAFVILARKSEVWQNYYVTKHKLYVKHQNYALLL